VPAAEEDTSLTALGSTAVAPTGYTSALTYKQIAAAADTFTNTSYYLSNRYLGIAGNFHIVAFNTATLNAHTNGNILAANLKANTNFGTNNLENELSYVQNYLKVDSVSASSDKHVLVLGSDNTVGTADNGSHFTIAGTKLDRPLNIWQDADTSVLPFIDLAAVKTSVAAISNNLSAMSDANLSTGTLDTAGGSTDASYLTLTDADATGVWNTTAAKLQSYKYLGIKGFTSGGTGAVIINIDCSGVSSVTLPSSTIYVNGTALSFGEKKDFTEGGVIFNFTNCSNVTINTSLLYATIVAPGATVNVNQNLNGSVIADNVNIYAESHRDDFVKLPKPSTTTATVKAVKIWEYNDGSEMSSADTASLSATVQLYNGSTAVGSAVTLNTANSFTYTWSNLDTTGSYSIVETAVDGYTTSYSASGIASGEIRVTNKKNTTTTVTTTTSASVTKTWSDGNDNHTADSVTVYLYADNALSLDANGNARSLVLNSRNNWSGSFTDLPYYHEDGTTAISYTVQEAPVSGYTTTYGTPITTDTWEKLTDQSSTVTGTAVISIRSEDGTKALSLTSTNGTYTLAQADYDAADTAQQWKVTYTTYSSTYGMGFTLTNVKYSDQMLHFEFDGSVDTEHFDTVTAGSVASTDTTVTFYYHTQTVKNRTVLGIYALNKFGGSLYHKYIDSTGSKYIGEIDNTIPTISVYKKQTSSVSLSVTNTRDNKMSVTAQKIWGSNTTSEPVTVTLYRSTTNTYTDSSGGSTVKHTVSFSNEGYESSSPTFTVSDGSTLYITLVDNSGQKGPPDNATYAMGTKSGAVKVTMADSSTATYEIDNITADTVITLPSYEYAPGWTTTIYPFGFWTVTSREMAAAGKQVTLPTGAVNVETAVLNVNGNWSHTWDQLLADDGKGNAYYYYIVETVPDGSIATYQYTMDTATGEMTDTVITNTGTYKLPAAGGSGTILWYLTGLLLTGAAAGSLLLSARSRKRGG